MAVSSHGLRWPTYVSSLLLPLLMQMTGARGWERNHNPACQSGRRRPPRTAVRTDTHICVYYLRKMSNFENPTSAKRATTKVWSVPKQEMVSKVHLDDALDHAGQGPSEFS
eukprot:789367-Amphidinium_carterae.2